MDHQHPAKDFSLFYHEIDSSVQNAHQAQQLDEQQLLDQQQHEQALNMFRNNYQLFPNQAQQLPNQAPQQLLGDQAHQLPNQAPQQLLGDQVPQQLLGDHQQLPNQAPQLPNQAPQQLLGDQAPQQLLGEEPQQQQLTEADSTAPFAFHSSQRKKRKERLTKRELDSIMRKRLGHEFNAYRHTHSMLKNIHSKLMSLGVKPKTTKLELDAMKCGVDRSEGNLMSKGGGITEDHVKVMKDANVELDELLRELQSDLEKAEEIPKQ